MKIYDCTTFYSEHMMMDVRFGILDKYVEKFIVTESTYSHSGKRKKLNFDINNYPKYKDKIVYLVIDKEPDDLIDEEMNIPRCEIIKFDFVLRPLYDLSPAHIHPVTKKTHHKMLNETPYQKMIINEIDLNFSK